MIPHRQHQYPDEIAEMIEELLAEPNESRPNRAKWPLTAVRRLNMTVEKHHETNTIVAEMKVWQFADTGQKLTAYALYREVVTGSLSYGNEHDDTHTILDDGNERSMELIGTVDVDSSEDHDEIRQQMASLD